MFDLTLNLDFYVFYKISGEHQESDYVNQCLVVVKLHLSSLGPWSYHLTPTESSTMICFCRLKLQSRVPRGAPYMSRVVVSVLCGEELGDPV